MLPADILTQYIELNVENEFLVLLYSISLRLAISLTFIICCMCWYLFAFPPAAPNIAHSPFEERDSLFK